jgi:hypothetical protein
MAARLNLRQQEQTRTAIQTSQLVNRLQDFALGKKSKKDEDIVIDAARLKAIEILLRKSLPDLSAITLGGDPDGEPIKVIGKITNEIVRAAPKP